MCVCVFIEKELCVCFTLTGAEMEGRAEPRLSWVGP